MAANISTDKTLKLLYFMKFAFMLYFLIFIVNYFLTWSLDWLFLGLFFVGVSFYFYRIEEFEKIRPIIEMKRQSDETEKYLKSLPRIRRRKFIREMKKK